MIDLVNWQQEEPTDCGGERQLSVDGTSRVSREAQARICDRLGVRFPGATRPSTGLQPAEYGLSKAARSDLDLNMPRDSRDSCARIPPYPLCVTPKTAADGPKPT